MRMTSGEEAMMSGWWREQRDIVIAGVAMVGIALHLVWGFALGDVATSEVFLWVVLAVGGLPLVVALMGQLVRREFRADFLAAVSIVSATLLGEYLAGAIVVLMLSGGETLERHASARASSVLKALAERMPSVAHRRCAGGADFEPVALGDVRVGEVLVVLPHETCPVDGEVLEGHGTMNEAYLTGEPYEIAKAPGSAVISGAINGDAALVIRATRPAQDSRYARIMEVMRQSQQTRPRIRRLADQLGAVYTPVALAVGVGAWAWSGDPVRFLAVVVVATPCPLLIAIPVAIIGAISLAARRAVLVRDPSVLEQAALCRVLLVDKTGTLTYGRPTLTGVRVGEGWREDQLLSWVASAERYSKHPLAAALVEAARQRGLPTWPVAEISEAPGEGLTARLDGHALHVTSRKKLREAKHPAFEALPAQQAGLECVVLVDGRYGATFQLRDEPRMEGQAFIGHLGPRHAFERIVLVSGDRASEVAYLASRVGIETVYADQSPEQKVAIVRREMAHRAVMFLGDGINDAPAMSMATVGIAFGQGSAVTAQAAGAVILEPSLGKVDELLHISQRLRRIALQSALGGMGLSVVGMGFAAVGLLPPVAGAVLQEGVDLVSVLNALRMSRAPASLTDYEGAAGGR